MSEPSHDRRPLRVLLFSASRRAASLNTQLAAVAAGILTDTDVELDHARMEEFDCPSYDGDLEAASGIPEPAHELRHRIEAADAFVIASPEYNASMPGILKNAIDWTSRHRPQPFHARHALLMSASPSMVGGNRGLWSLRMPLEHLGCRVYPDMFSLATAHDQLADGRLVDARLHDRLAATITSFIDLVEADKHYPCAKAGWVEFLGEPQVAPELDRVQ